MNELSIFIDESGDFGEYDYRSPYYIIAMVFHKQEHSIHEAVDKLNHELSYIPPPVLCRDATTGNGPVATKRSA